MDDLARTPQRESHVLVVDDDPQIRLLVARLLRANGYRVSAARDGVEMKQVLGSTAVDLVVLDVMLPGASGFDLCRDLRRDSRMPVIMLTARGEEADRIAGLDLGADDYLAKPFSPRELVARINAVMRRVRADGATHSLTAARAFRFAGWTLDVVRRELTDPHGAVVDLSTGEFDMLRAFTEAPGKVLGRDLLLDLAKNRIATGFDRVVDVQISRLRKKIESDAQAEPMIKTIRGTGYMFMPAVERR
ncbi:response regulator transcription factor [Bosea sp. 685]|uniref:response regulator transcription factor n=1 Tax=Bosea sp. 685 TaxID=3080057 RepID=UPI0028932EE4|nr:response regulator transcription factor [Bosea sp. 685]WNJ87976.1 response regulator transcription factor [Bosea sp. 685]